VLAARHHDRDLSRRKRLNQHAAAGIRDYDACLSQRPLELVRRKEAGDPADFGFELVDAADLEQDLIADYSLCLETLDGADEARTRRGKPL